MMMIIIWDTKQNNGLIILQQRKIKKSVTVCLASCVVQTKRHKLGGKGKEKHTVYREGLLRDILSWRGTTYYYNRSEKEELSWLG